VTEDYLLIDNIIQVNDVNNPSSSTHNDDTETEQGQHDDGKSTQRKGKETKEKETEKNKMQFLDHVHLTEPEYKRLIEDYSKSVVDSKIEDLDTYISNKGKNPYKDHNKTIRNWMKRDNVKSVKEKEEEQKRNEPTKEQKKENRIQELSQYMRTREVERFCRL